MIGVAEAVVIAALIITFGPLVAVGVVLAVGYSVITVLAVYDRLKEVLRP